MTIASPPLSQEHNSAQSMHRREAVRECYLFTPLIDFLCLGGGSLLLFIPLMFLDVATFQPKVVATILFLAHFINSPHFAHSYQIFYRNFAGKAFGQTVPLQRRGSLSGNPLSLGSFSGARRPNRVRCANGARDAGGSFAAVSHRRLALSD